MPEKEYKYKATCYRATYWKETLWEVGDVYEGDDPPNKWFKGDWEPEPELPPAMSGTDPRSTKELTETLQKKYTFAVPKSWTRKKIWAKLHDLEIAESKDAVTNPEPSIPKAEYTCLCGFLAKSKTGGIAHERQCATCKEIAAGDKDEAHLPE